MPRYEMQIPRIYTIEIEADNVDEALMDAKMKIRKTDHADESEINSRWGGADIREIPTMSMGPDY